MQSQRFVFYCNAEKTNLNSFPLLPIWNATFPLTTSPGQNENDPLPASIPDEILWVNPPAGGIYELDPLDIGLHSLDETCTPGVDGAETAQVKTRIRKILPNSKVVVEIEFSREVTGGKIQLYWKGIEMEGNFTFLKSRTVRFETVATGYVNRSPLYRVKVSGFKNQDQSEVPPAEWYFSSNFNGDKDHDFALQEHCSQQNGTNECKVQTSKRGNDQFQEYVQWADIRSFYSDIDLIKPNESYHG